MNGSNVGANELINIDIDTQNKSISILKNFLDFLNLSSPNDNRFPKYNILQDHALSKSIHPSYRFI